MLVWLILACLSLMAGLYICAPLYSANISSRGGILTIFAAILIGTAGLYALIGRSDLTQPRGPAPLSIDNLSADNSNIDDLSLEQLTVQLGQKLTEQPKQPMGWLLYARSLLQLGRYEEGLKAYAVAVEQTGDDAAIAAELARAREFVTAQRAALSGTSLQGSAMPMPDRATIDAAGQLDAQDRVAFIESMVAGLAMRLDEAPQDQAGWARLLRARGVLGQTEQLLADQAKLKEIFATEPEILAAIYEAAGLEH